MTDRLRYRPKTFNEVNGRAPESSANGAAPKPDKPKSSKASRKVLGRFGELNCFCDVTGRDCTAAEQAVWLRMFRHANNGECRLSRKRLANESGMSLPTVKRAVRGLIDKGFVTLKTRGNSGGQTNVYGVRAKPQT